MKLLIAGSRSIKNFDLSKYVDDNVSMIISGGAEGVDTIAEKFADTHKISKLILYPQYKTYGKAAPLLRNKKMIEIADSVLVIWDGISKGSKFTIEYSKKAEKKLTVVNINDKEGN